MRAKLRSLLVALCVGVGIVLLAALAAVLVALIGGSGLVGGMNAARSILLIAGGLVMLLGALGILAPRHFSGVGDRLGRGLRSRFGSSDATGAVVRGRGAALVRRGRLGRNCRRSICNLCGLYANIGSIGTATYPITYVTRASTTRAARGTAASEAGALLVTARGAGAS